jgi:hypothetical protein
LTLLFKNAKIKKALPKKKEKGRYPPASNQTSSSNSYKILTEKTEKVKQLGLNKK